MQGLRFCMGFLLSHHHAGKFVLDCGDPALTVIAHALVPPPNVEIRITLQQTVEYIVGKRYRVCGQIFYKGKRNLFRFKCCA